MRIVFKNFINLTKVEHKNVLSIRNTDYIRNNMKSNDVIEIKDHLKWINKLKQDNTNIYYAVYFDDKIVGAIYITNINYKQKESTWGLYFKQNINPLISSISAYCIIDKVFNDLDLATLNVEVNKNNLSAYKFNLSFGFKIYDEKIENNKTYYLMSMTKDTWLKKKNSNLIKTVQKKVLKTSIKYEE